MKYKRPKIYKIVKVCNKKLKCVLYETSRVNTAKNYFKRMYDLQSNILFPKKFTTFQSGVKYTEDRDELLLIRSVPKSGKFTPRVVERVDGSKLSEVKIDDQYILMDKFYLEIEEKFMVYKNKKKSKMIGSDILKKHIIPKMRKIESIYRFNNKIIFDDMVIFCKNVIDSNRLYTFIFDFIHPQPFNNILFVGDAPESMKSEIIDRIVLITGLTKSRICRLTLK